MTSDISVALCADKNIEVGLHVTLYSLLESSKTRMKIYFLQQGYNEEDIGRIRRTLKEFSDLYVLEVIDFSDSIFSKYRGLYQNKFAYARIMLAEIIGDSKVIYLDSDLVIKRDLGTLFQTGTNGCVIAASGSGTIEWSLENKFYASLGLNKNAKYFNSGVMLIDLNEWRKQDVTRKCIEFADRYPDMLLAADQTVLNYIFYENKFLELDQSFNKYIYTNSKPISRHETDCIFHFVGSPKPWDILGEMVHRNYSLFYDTLKKTEFARYRTYFDLSLQRVKRTFRMTRAYYKCMATRPT